MKRHIVVCMALCLACSYVVGQDQIEGWKVRSGKWQQEGDIITCEDCGDLVSDVRAHDVKITGKIMALDRATSGRYVGLYNIALAIHHEEDDPVMVKTFLWITEKSCHVFKRPDAKSTVGQSTLCRGEAGIKPPSGWTPFAFVYQDGKVSVAVGRVKASGMDTGRTWSGDRIVLSVHGATKLKDLEVTSLDKAATARSAKAKKAKPKSLKTSKPVSKGKRFFYLQKEGCVFAVESMGLAKRPLVKWFDDKLCLGDDLCYYLLAAVDEGRKDNYAWSDDEPTVRITVVKDRRKKTTESFGNICMHGSKRQGRIFEVEEKLNKKILELGRRAYNSEGTKKKKLEEDVVALKKRLALIEQAEVLFEPFGIPSTGKTWAIIAFSAHFDTDEIVSVDFREVEEYEPMEPARGYPRLLKDLGVDFPRVW